MKGVVGMTDGPGPLSVALRKHLATAKKLCPPGSQLQAELRHLAGNLKRRQGRLSEARYLMEEGLHLKRKDPEHFNEAAVAYSLHGLANVYSIMKARHFSGSPENAGWVKAGQPNHFVPACCTCLTLLAGSPSVPIEQNCSLLFLFIFLGRQIPSRLTHITAKR